MCVLRTATYSNDSWTLWLTKIAGRIAWHLRFHKNIAMVIVDCRIYFIQNILSKISTLTPIGGGHLESQTVYVFDVDEIPCVITYEKYWSNKKKNTKNQISYRKNHSVDGQRQIAHKIFLFYDCLFLQNRKICPIANSLFRMFHKIVYKTKRAIRAAEFFSA